MIAAIYARKSTAQDDVDDDQKSVQQQIDNARAFAASKGWTVAEGHIYCDDAISGAETRRLVNRQRLLDAAASGRPPFGVVIMRDSSRFSREDGDEAFMELKRLARHVEIWFYQDAAQFTFGTLSANVVGFIKAEMNAEYRRQSSKLGQESHLRKAKAGHVTGGRVFGYDNVCSACGRAIPPGGLRCCKPAHVERRINEGQAAVVRRIFELSGSGWGYSRITKHLNAKQAPAPRPQQDRPAGWSPSTIYEVLHRDVYRGHLVWNKTRKRDAAGRTAVTARPESEWLRSDRPELRIVSDDLWNAVHARLGARRQFVRGQAVRPGRDIESKYLLSGFARCGTCGGAMVAMSRRRTGQPRALFYGCSAHQKRGPLVCDNALVLPIDRVNDAVLTALVRKVLRPAVAMAIMDEVFKALRPTARAASVVSLKSELRVLDAKIANLTAAIEQGAAVGPIVAKLQERQAEREALLTTLGAAQASEQLQVDRQTIERKVLAQLATWRTQLTTDARQALREVLSGPVRLTPTGEQYHFEGNTTTGSFIAGLIGAFNLYGVPSGIRDKVNNTKFEGIAA